MHARAKEQEVSSFRWSAFARTPLASQTARRRPGRAILALARIVCLALALLLCGCASGGAREGTPDVEVTEHLSLEAATQYDVAFREDGTYLLTIGETDRYLLVPDDIEPAGGGDLTRIALPLHDTYLAASSAMDFFVRLDALDAVRMTSTKRSDWSLEEVASALEDGSMLYVGKYSAPDYERVLSEGAQVAIESTMIYHSPEVAERLTALGIPVLVERSSYETSPLGRLEWIKLYGLLTGRLDEAERVFDEQVAAVERVSSKDPSTRPNVAFFSISANGHVVVRKPGDYVSQMIDLAGGQYFLDAKDTPADTANALSTMNMEMESFYEIARDADIIIYNSAIDDELKSIDDLVAKSPRLADFMAVRNDRVWCTGKDLFQQPTCVADMVQEMSAAFAEKDADGGADRTNFEHLYRVRWKDGQ